MTKCQKIEVDDKCEVISNRVCWPKSTTTLKQNEICKFNRDETRCSLQTKECSDYIASTCSQFGDNKCIKIKVTTFNYQTGLDVIYDQCQLVTVDGKCEVDNDGKCVDKSTGGPDANQKCSFNPLHTECKPIYKQCYEILDTTKCNTCQTSPANSKCLKIDDGSSTRCKNVEVNDSCEIKESGQCDVKTATDNNKCRFNTSYSGCEYYTVDDQNCVLSDTSDSLSCTEGTNLANKDKNKCDYVWKDDDYTYKCQKTYKECSEYTDQTKCNSAPEVDNEKCYYTSSKCKRVDLEDYDYCTWNSQNGKCEEKSSVTLPTNTYCYKDEGENSIDCELREKSCSDYSDSNCGGLSPEVKLCFNLGVLEIVVMKLKLIPNVL